MPERVRDQRGIVLARSLASAQIAWALAGTAWLLAYAATAGAFEHLAGPMPFRAAHFGHAIGLMLLLALLTDAVISRRASVSIMLWALAVFAIPLLIWQMLSFFFGLMAPPENGELVRAAAIVWGGPIAFLATGLGVLAAFHARASLRLAIIAAVAPALLCVMFGAAMLSAFGIGRAQTLDAGIVVLIPAG
jgi:hypothetical protein